MPLPVPSPDPAWDSRLQLTSSTTRSYPSYPNTSPELISKVLARLAPKSSLLLYGNAVARRDTRLREWEPLLCPLKVYFRLFGTTVTGVRTQPLFQGARASSLGYSADIRPRNPPVQEGGSQACMLRRAGPHASLSLCWEFSFHSLPSISVGALLCGESLSDSRAIILESVYQIELASPRCQ